jgi:hypothetical protein
VAEDRLAEEPDGERRRRLLGADPQREHTPRIRIDDRPDKDRAEEAADAREVDQPDVAGAFRDQPSGAAREHARGGGPGARAPERALDARARRLEAEPREDARDAAAPPPRPLALEPVRDLAHEIGEPVHGRLRLDEPGAAGFDLAVPVDDGLGGQDEGAGGRRNGEALPRPVPQDREALPRAVARPAARMDATESGSQEFVLGALPRDGLAERGVLRGERTAAGELGQPPMMGERDLAGDEEEGADHRENVPAVPVPRATSLVPRAPGGPVGRGLSTVSATTTEVHSGCASDAHLSRLGGRYGNYGKVVLGNRPGMR